jgi:hypothetical protein
MQLGGRHAVRLELRDNCLLLVHRFPLIVVYSFLGQPEGPSCNALEAYDQQPLEALCMPVCL